MSPTIHRKYKYFHSTVQTAEDRRSKVHFCAPFAVWRNVMLNLYNVYKYKNIYWIMYQKKHWMHSFVKKDNNTFSAAGAEYSY